MGTCIIFLEGLASEGQTAEDHWCLQHTETVIWEPEMMTCYSDQDVFVLDVEGGGYCQMFLKAVLVLHHRTQSSHLCLSVSVWLRRYPVTHLHLGTSSHTQRITVIIHHTFLIHIEYIFLTQVTIHNALRLQQNILN